MKLMIHSWMTISMLAILAFASTSFAESKARTPSAINSWKQELESFKTRQFMSLAELQKSASEFQNKLMDDESIRYEEKVSLRKQMYELENQKSADFPAPQIMGFKKVLVDPNDPSRGYVIEPEYK
jgi:hypothetical protein